MTTPKRRRARTPKRKTPKRKTPKRRSRTPKRKTPKRRSRTPKRKTPKRRSRTPKRKTPKRRSRTPKRKTPKRRSRTPKRKTPKRRSPMKSISTVVKEDCSQFKTWYVDKAKKIGNGQAGTVYLACKKNDCNYVVKVQKANTTQMYKREMEIVDRLTNLGLPYIPKQYAMFTCNKLGYTVMEQLFKPKDVLRSEENIESILKDYLDDLYTKYKIVFVDIHEDNVMTRKNGEIVLIDFGWAVSFNNENDIVREHPAGRNISIKTLKSYQDTNLRLLKSWYKNHPWRN